MPKRKPITLASTASPPIDGGAEVEHDNHVVRFKDRVASSHRAKELNASVRRLPPQREPSPSDMQLRRLQRLAASTGARIPEAPTPERMAQAGGTITMESYSVAIEVEQGGKRRVESAPAARLKVLDLLAVEHAHGRISDAALAVGREIEEALTILGGSGQSQWLQGDRIDPGRRVELAVVAGLDRADAALATMKRVNLTLGHLMGGILVSILRDRLTFAQVAAQRGKHSQRDGLYIGRLFRDGLEAIADCNTS